MTDGAGAIAIGSWFGTGPARGIALVFTLAGALGVVVSILAMRSSYYRRLSTAYANGKSDDTAAASASEQA